MTKFASWAEIGAGNVNSALATQIAEQPETHGLESKPLYIARRDGLHDSNGHLMPGVTLADAPRVDVGFLAIPSAAKPEMTYLTHLLGQGSVAVTCAKGASANYPRELQALSQGGKLLGDTATVGGGTGMLRILAEYLARPDLNELHLTLNGTLAAITSSSKPLAEAVQDAIHDGLAEPGNTSPRAVARAELDDVAYKATNAYNKLLAVDGETIDWQLLRLVLSEDQIEQALEERRRLIVSVYPKGSEGYGMQHGLDELIDGFDVLHGNWRLLGGFSALGRNAVRASLERTTGPDVGFAVGLGPGNRNGIYSLTGPGAGPYPTSSMMLGDWARIRPELAEMQAETPRVKQRKFVRKTMISLDSIETGIGYDERTLDAEAFDTVNNWRTGWKPIFSITTAGGGQLYGSNMVAEAVAKADELEKAGRHVRFTANGVLVNGDTLTIRHNDESFGGLTVWVVRDQKLHDQYYGPGQIDNWWGTYIRRSKLPELTHDGVEAELTEALRPYASIYTHEMDAARTKERAGDVPSPSSEDIASEKAFLQWKQDHPMPTFVVDTIWDRQLGIEHSNNFYLSLLTPDDAPKLGEKPARRYLTTLEDTDSGFMDAARLAAQKLVNWMKYDLSQARSGEGLSFEERREMQIRRWICDMYTTEALSRLRELGAPTEELSSLM